MNKISNPSQRVHDFNMEHFCIRLTARLCIILICFLTLYPRLMTILADPSLPTLSQLIVIISIPFPFLMSLVIGLEYFLYKKLGPGIVRYSNLVDIMLLLFFTADWTAIVVSTLNDVEKTYPISFKLGALFGFTTFSWRTLMVTLIVQKWKLKIIPPTIVLAVTAGYGIHYLPGAFLRTRTASTFQL